MSIVSDTAVAASDTNYYAFQVQNLTQAEALLSAAQTTMATGGTAITGDTLYAVSPDQNSVISDGDVLELQVTETGTVTDLSSAQLVAVVEYI
jgi:archaellum component FlaG (FlaF/FlaG flagellin family)